MANKAHKKKKKTSPRDSTDELFGLVTAYLKNESDVKAKGWTIRLERLDPDQKRFEAKIMILCLK